MAFLRLANEEDGRRYYYVEDGEETDEYIELRTEITKRRAKELLKMAPKQEDDIDGGLRFIERAFAELVISWSLPEDPNVANYLKLSADAASWVDKTVGNHLRIVLGAEAEDAEKKLPESDSLALKD